MTPSDIFMMIGFAMFINGIAYGNAWLFLPPVLAAGLADWWFA